MKMKFYQWASAAMLFMATTVVGFTQAPANDLCADAIAITCAGTIDGTSINATSDVPPAPASCFTQTQPGVWYTVQGTGGTITINTCNNLAYDTKLSVFEGNCTAMTCVAGNDDFCGAGSEVSWSSTLGVTYYVLVHGFGGSTGPFTLEVTMDDVIAPTFTTCNANIVVDNDPGVCGAVVTFSNPIASDNCSGSTGTGKYYIRSNTTGEPWGSSSNTDAMNAVFGSGNWTAEFFETATIGTVFSSNTRFVFLEGSDDNALELSAFLTTNMAAIESWVAGGGVLFINAAPNEGGNIDVGFGSTILNYNYGVTNCPTVNAVSPAHPIFSGPFTPVGTSFIGDDFSHASVSGNGLTNLIEGCGQSQLSFKTWGAGSAFFGGMTTANWHSPLPEAQNLRQNIFAFINDQYSPGTTVTQIAGLPSGSVFPVGVSTLVFEAEDLSGNTATCTFTVTVNDAQAPLADAGVTANGTFNTGTISVAITDNNTSYAPLTVSGLPSLYLTNSIDSVCIDITHTWTSDLGIYLVSPIGTEYELSTYNGGSGDNYTSTCFKMSAITPITSGAAPFTGTYIPEGAGGFDAFVGEDPNGTWQLKVADDAGGDQGTINYFYMSFTITDLSVLPDVTGECVTLTPPTGTDVCEGAVTATSNDPLTYNADGTYTVTWVYSDSEGNTSTQQQVVVVDDTTAPVPSVGSLSPITVCTDITITDFPTATDNCVGSINATTTDPLTYSAQGSYTVTWTYNDGNGNTATQTQSVNVVDCTGLEDYSLIVNAQVYPNPNNGQFTLSLTEMPQGNTQVRVITTLGQVVYTTNLTAQVMTFDLSSLAASTYYLQIVAEDGVVTKQIIVRQ